MTKPSRPIAIVMLLLVALFAASAVQAWDGGCREQNYYPWHGDYYYTAWGRPAALVVPPNADYQTHWGWGAGNTRITRIRAQCEPGWPGTEVYGGSRFRTTPPWPSHTDQFGVYYVRGPW